MQMKIKIKSSLYLAYYADACIERMGKTAPKKRRSGGEKLATLCPIRPTRKSIPKVVTIWRKKVPFLG